MIIKKWYINIDSKNHGPFSEDELRNKFTIGELALTTPIWCEGMTEWVQYKDSDITMAKNNRTVPPPLQLKTPQHKQSTIGEPKLLLKINTDFYGFIGAIGRWEYCKKNIFIGYSIAIAGLITAAAGSKMEYEGRLIWWLLGMPLILIGIAAIIYAIVSSIGLIHRRVKDIMGTTQNSVVFTIITCILFFFPFTNPLVGLVLCLMPGTAYNRVGGRAREAVEYENEKAS